MALLKTGEKVLTAFAQSAAGPGWANQPIRIIIRERDGGLREEWLQPDEQTAEELTLYAVSQAAHGAMTRAVERHLREG